MINHNIRNELREYIDNLSITDNDDVYRYLWSEHVREDVASYAESKDIELTNDEIDKITELYVYEGEYDCEYGYWSNIETLINRVHKEKD